MHRYKPLETKYKDNLLVTKLLLFVANFTIGSLSAQSSR